MQPNTGVIRVNTTTGTILFWVDLACVAVFWPLGFRLAAPAFASLPQTITGATYACIDLLMLFAMGLYRRKAILAFGRSVARLPLVVGMGAVASTMVVAALP
jgi:hypothetical protein